MNMQIVHDESLYREMKKSGFADVLATERRVESLPVPVLRGRGRTSTARLRCHVDNSVTFLRLLFG